MELHILLVFMIVAAVVAVEVKDLLSSVVAVGTVGFALCLAFLILKAPDLGMVAILLGHRVRAEKRKGDCSWPVFLLYREACKSVPRSFLFCRR